MGTPRSCSWFERDAAYRGCSTAMRFRVWLSDGKIRGRCRGMPRGRWWRAVQPGIQDRVVLQRTHHHLGDVGRSRVRAPRARAALGRRCSGRSGVRPAWGHDSGDGYVTGDGRPSLRQRRARGRRRGLLGRLSKKNPWRCVPHRSAHASAASRPASTLAETIMPPRAPVRRQRHGPASRHEPASGSMSRSKRHPKSRPLSAPSSGFRTCRTACR